MNDKSQKPVRIANADIATVAAEGVARALAARENCVRELNAAEVADVSGGALLKSPLIYGGDLAGILKGLNTKLTVPTLNTLNTLNTLTTVG